MNDSDITDFSQVINKVDIVTRPRDDDWFKQFVKWLRRLLGTPTTRSKIKIIEQYHNGGSASVLRLQDPTIPGAVDLWRIDRHHEHTKFFICIINVAQLREDLAATRSGAASRGDRRGLAGGLWSQIAAQSDVLASHYWVTGWDSETSGVDRHGRNYRSHRVHDLSLLAVDLQGITASFAGNRHAYRFARDIIKRLAANEFRELAHHRNWVKAVESINWEEWLEGMGRTYIDQTHVLRPRKSQHFHRQQFE